jgi:DNA primase large subunit
MPMPTHPPEIESPVLLARFPFLPQGEPWMQSLLHDNQVDFETLVNGDWMEEVRARGNLRMLESIKHDEGVNVATRQDIHTEYGQMIEGLGFYYAMFVVCASFDERLMKRWIEGEASRADSLLGSTVDGETFDLVARTYLSDLRQQQTESNASSIHTTRAPIELFEIPMVDFIELSPRITGTYWRLSNRPLRDGWVTMDPASGENSRERLARLLKERIREVLVERCKANMERLDEETAAKLAEPVGRIVAELQSQRSHDVQVTAANEGDWPPCMIAAINDLDSGENVNHAGRRFLGNMSRALGLSREQCCSFFVNAPDYKAETTEYQVNQLYQTEYTPEKCDTLRLHARCPVASGLVDDQLCRRDWLTHPLKYVRAQQRRRIRDAPPPEQQAEPDSAAPDPPAEPAAEPATQDNA